MIMLIEKNRHSNTGAASLMVFTFGMGVLISPMLQYSLSISNGPQLVGVAAAYDAAVFFTMAADGAPHQSRYEFARPLFDGGRGGADGGRGGEYVFWIFPRSAYHHFRRLCDFQLAARLCFKTAISLTAAKPAM